MYALTFVNEYSTLAKKHVVVDSLMIGKEEIIWCFPSQDKIGVELLCSMLCTMQNESILVVTQLQSIENITSFFFPLVVGAVN